MPKPQLSRQKLTSPKRVLGAVVAVVVAFLLLASVVGLAEKYAAIRGRVRDLKDQQQQLTEKQEALRKANEYIGTKEGAERELRTKYNVIKPGEGMVIITTAAEEEAEEGRFSRIGHWWDSLLRGLGIREE